MENKKVLIKYYLFGSPFFFSLIFFSFYFSISSFYSSLMLLGFIWAYAFNAPGMREKQSLYKGKLSVLSLFYKCQKTIDEIFLERKFKGSDVLKRHLFLFIFSLVLMFIAKSFNVVYLILGVFVFELFFYFWKKLN